MQDILSNPKISVVIPVYDVEKYLRECLDSVVNQTFRDIEIIIVNDCSPDNCQDIIDEYAKKDHRIKVVLHEQNRGLSAARNTGIALCRGDLIDFLDSDDVLEDLEVYQKAYNLYQSIDADLYIFSLSSVDENLKHLSKVVFMDFSEGDLQIIEDKKKIQDLFLLRKIAPNVCERFYKRSLIEKYNIRFQEGIIMEDTEFAAKVICVVEKVVMTKESKLKYRIRANSIMNKSEITESFLKSVGDVFYFSNQSLMNNLVVDNKTQKVKLFFANILFLTLRHYIKTGVMSKSHQKLKFQLEVLDGYNMKEIYYLAIHQSLLEIFDAKENMRYFFLRKKYLLGKLYKSFFLVLSIISLIIISNYFE